MFDFGQNKLDIGLFFKSNAFFIEFPLINCKFYYINSKNIIQNAKFQYFLAMITN